jgi:hypothetical protein
MTVVRSVESLYQGDRLWCDLSRESQLLTCVRVGVDVLTAERIEELCFCDLDWATVLHLAAKNDVSELLYQSLSETCPEAVPAFALEQLRQRYQTGMLQSCFLAQELVQLLQKFNQEDIPALAYKGPTLAAALYGSLALRPFGDLDILIHPEDLVRAKGVLIAVGYDTLAADDRLEAYNIWSDSERDFVRQDGQAVLDLHWKITPEFFPTGLNMESLWARRQSVTLLGTSVDVMSSEDLLLALCAHGAKECWSKLKWVADVAQLLRQSSNLDWEAVLARARQAHLERIIRLGVGLAHGLLDAPIPGALAEQIQSDRPLQQLLRQSVRYLFGFEAGTDYRWSPTRFRLSTRDRWQDWVIYGVHRTLVPNVRDRQQVMLPASWAWLYILIRPLRLTAEKLGWVTRPHLGGGKQAECLASSKSTERNTRPVSRADCNENGESDAAASSSKNAYRKLGDRPCIRTDLNVYPFDHECIIYCPRQELAMSLNRSSTAILKCCNGQHSWTDIATQIAEQFDQPLEAIAEEVYAAVLELRQLGLLEEP